MYIGLYRTPNKAFSCLVLSYLRGAGGFVEDQWYMSKEVSCRNHPYISSQYLRRAKSRSSETNYDQPLIYLLLHSFEILKSLMILAIRLALNSVIYSRVTLFIALNHVF